MYSKLTIIPKDYQSTLPYPHYFQDNFLGKTFARIIQHEILQIPIEHFDRYDNPFEQKNTLRDKFKMPKNLLSLFSYWESEEFVSELSNIVGYPLYIDRERNFWGVHTYNENDRLDIHVDAGLHPKSNQKKQLTIGLYLSLNYTEENGCNLEIWDGSNAGDKSPILYKKINSISPLFNRFIMFTCNDFSWHGNPEPVNGDAKRIFLTMSYMSENYEDKNKRVKAYFVKRPCDPEDTKKDELRLLRSDPEKYKEIYRLQ